MSPTQTPGMPGRRLVVEADGGSRGNPGVAGYGALVRDAESGAVLAERAAPLGKRSNNVAEYRGLIAGLERVVTIDASAQVEVKMDSKLVVEQMAGRWKIKHEDMRALALEARDLVRQIQAAGGSVRWTWIPREINKAADKLSNDGMDGRTIDRMVGARPSSPSPEVPVESMVVSAPPLAPEPMVAGEPLPPVTGVVRILLVRHGSTALTTQGRLSGGGGLSDPSLDPMGQGEAEAAARVVAAYLRQVRSPDSSPLRMVTSALARARETGVVVARGIEDLARGGVDSQVDDWWDEQALGVWEGLTVAQVKARWPESWARYVDSTVDPSDQRPPEGESTAEVIARVRRAVARICETPGDVVVVTSRRPILVALADAFGLPPGRFATVGTVGTVGTDPGSVTAVEIFPDGHVSVPFVNRTGTPDGRASVRSSGA